MKKLAAVIIIVFVFNSIAFSQDYNASSQLTNSSSSGKEYKNNINSGIFNTGIVFIEVTILIMVLYYWRKTHSESKNKSETTYKRNISAIRDERVAPVFNKEISKKRKALNKLVKIKELNGKNIGQKAKAHNISKGELYLAAKIHSLTQQVK